jgi:CBS domain-containing protein
MSTAGEVCSRQVITVSKECSLVDVACRMRDEHVGSVIVTDDGPAARKPIGILTDRDIVVGVVAKALRHMDALVAGDVMSSSLVTAIEDEDLDAALARMRTFGIRRAPVIDGKGKLVGLLAFDDVVAHLAQEAGELARLIEHEQRDERTKRP